MTFSVQPTDELPEVWVVTPAVFSDDRGEFLETWRADLFRQIGIDVEFVQDNQSRSLRGVLRGLHFQRSPHAQGKLVRTLVGEIFDVAVDIRRSSPTFGAWTGRILSDSNHQMMWIPEGFAHGYLTMSESAIVAYKTTRPYQPDADRALFWADPEVGVIWPDVGRPPLLSPKDEAAPLLDGVDVFA